MRLVQPKSYKYMSVLCTVPNAVFFNNVDQDLLNPFCGMEIK